MGSRSRFKPKIEVPNRRYCVRCHAPIDNEFRKQPWCVDCDAVLQAQNFTGVQVLEMIVAIMPPTPPHPEATIRAYTVLKLAREIMIQNNLLLRDEQNPDDKAPVKSTIITR